MTDIKHISEDDFKDHTLQVNGYVLVECYSGVRSILQIMEPVLIKLRKKFGGSIRHYRVKTTENPSLIEEFHIYGEPVYLIFHDGTLIDRVDGMLPLSEFMEKLEKHVKNNME